MGYIFARGVITFLHVLLLFFMKLNFRSSNMMMMTMTTKQEIYVFGVLFEYGEIGWL